VVQEQKKKKRNTNTKKNNSNNNNNSSNIDLSSKSDVHHPLSRKSTGGDFINNVVATRKSFNWQRLDPDLFECNSDNENKLTVQEV